MFIIKINTFQIEFFSPCRQAAYLFIDRREINKKSYGNNLLLLSPQHKRAIGKFEGAFIGAERRTIIFRSPKFLYYTIYSEKRPIVKISYTQNSTVFSPPISSHKASERASIMWNQREEPSNASIGIYCRNRSKNTCGFGNIEAFPVISPQLTLSANFSSRFQNLSSKRLFL